MPLPLKGGLCGREARTNILTLRHHPHECGEARCVGLWGPLGCCGERLEMSTFH
jgi:hypothetical protein